MWRITSDVQRVSRKRAKVVDCDASFLDAFAARGTVVRHAVPEPPSTFANRRKIKYFRRNVP